MNKKVTLSIDEEIYSEFQEYCNENAIMLSKKIELWIDDFLKGKDLKNSGKEKHKEVRK
jgi:hypothetical protein